MLISYALGQGSIILRVKIPDSTKSDNSGVTGLLFSTSGLSISAIADNEATATTYSGANLETITTLGTFAAPTAGKCRFKEVDATNLPGIFEIQLADSRYAVSSSKSLLITIKAIAASNSSQVDVLIPLTTFNPYTAPSTPAQIATAIFQDTTLSDFTVNNSIGQFLYPVRIGTAQAGTVSSITLDSGASATSSIYNGLLLRILSGAGVGQVRTILAYVGGTKVASPDRNFQIAPDNTSVFALLPANSPALSGTLAVTANLAVIRSSTAQTGSSNSITLDAGASATNNLYNLNIITLTGGTGIGQTRTIVSYSGTSKIAIVDKNWATIPDNTSTFNILPSNSPILFSDQGVAQTATSSSITLQSTASSTTDIYNNFLITILSGTGAGQTRSITAYNGSTKIASNSPNWVVIPDSSSAYAIIPTPQSPLFDSNGNTLSILAPSVTHSGSLSTSLLSSFFLTNSTTTFASAVAGSVVKEIASNSSGGGGATAASIWDYLLTSITTSGSIGKLIKDNLDATISSRSTYAGADTAGITTLLSRLTATRATALDNLDATISSRSTYAGADTAGTTILLSRLTATRAGLLDNLNATITSRLAAGDVTVGDLTPTALSKFFLTNSTSTYAAAVAGSVVKEISSGGGGSTPAQIWDYLLTSISTTSSIGKLIKDKLSPLTFSGTDLHSSIQSYSSGQDPATLVLNALASSYTAPGTIGALISTTTDPWTTILPGSYPSNSAGFIIGNNLNASVSSRLPASSYAPPPSPTSIATAVWTDSTSSSDFTPTGSIGKALTTLSTFDPWSINLPGSYPSNSAGNILGNVSSSDFITLATMVPTANTPNSVGDCLNAARVQGFGQWSIDSLNKILYLYNHDGSVAAQFNLDSIIPPPSTRIPF